MLGSPPVTSHEDPCRAPPSRRAHPLRQLPHSPPTALCHQCLLRHPRRCLRELLQVGLLPEPAAYSSWLRLTNCEAPLLGAHKFDVLNSLIGYSIMGANIHHIFYFCPILVVPKLQLQREDRLATTLPPGGPTYKG
ncbi:uncharacterized protein LOC120696493 isoform X1 [Panicum virgatum]|uniref:uncharacterized protein LOC120696493 isoform X1 n=1 Tax=Panicum virgatum TaxID=38727 RepID=UPI0019D56C19|nr:uncharacterized protein LOC120696493 isoform X1 [Panicum virgatum]